MNMKKANYFILLLLFIGITTISAQTATPPAAGDGTSGSPYEIATIENLFWISQNSSNWNKYYIQTADIDATITNTWDVGNHDEDDGTTPDVAMGFSPIGSFSTPFTGSYNGNGHIINNLFINRPKLSRTGLFGYVRYSEFIKNLGVTNAFIHGNQWVGIIAGATYASLIENTFSSGDIAGFSYVGGLAGNIYNTPINNCFSNANATSTSFRVGGLVGNTIGVLTIINQCYSTGLVDGAANVGGLVGIQENGATITNSFWDIDIYTTDNGLGTGKTTAEMQNRCTFLTADWDFEDEIDNGSDDYWTINTGEYPSLEWENNINYMAPCAVLPLGVGTDVNPYQIETIENLVWISENSAEWDKYYVQTANIDASTTPNWFRRKGFIPIGNTTTKFTGEYDGQNHTIDGLYISRSSNMYVGLFGYAAGAVVKNLGVVNANIRGSNRTGVIAGLFIGTISNCYTTGDVDGHGEAGGLVGSMSISGNTVDNSYSSCNVKGYRTIGGLIGNSQNNTINNCFSMGSVTRDAGSTDNAVGSLIGNNETTNSTSCYSTGAVIYTGTTSPSDKGFIGTNTSGTHTNNFFNSETTNQTSATGATAKTTTEMQNVATFTTLATGLTTAWDFSGTQNDDSGTEDIWNIVTSINNGYPYLQNAPNGLGTEADPYEIATLEDLRWLSLNSTHWDKHFIQTVNIDATSTAAWNSGEGFLSIGNDVTLFTGTYNGKAHIIDGLFINRATNNLGLFGYINSAKIDSLGITNVDITGSFKNYIGGLVGYNTHSTISNSFCTGSVSGYGYVGGLVGYNKNASTINNSYSSVSVSGTNNVGGFVGDNNFSTISNSYSTSTVTGTTAVGGFVGENINNPTISNCFWNIDIYATDNGFATGKTTTQMKNMCTYIDGSEASWDFMDETTNGTNDFWGMNSSENSGYPFLAWQTYSNTEICCPAPSEAATSIVMGATTTSTITLTSFTAPTNGATGYAIYVKGNNSWVAPNNGDEPTPDLSWNDAGQQCIYFGTSATPNITVTNLHAGSRSYFKVYAYNDCSGDKSYETTGVGTFISTDKLDQTITFAALDAKTYGVADYDPGATADGGVVTYSSSDTDVATIASGKIHIVGAGTCTIYADQPGSSAYNPAAQKSQSLTVNTKNLTVNGYAAANKVYDGNTSTTVSGAQNLTGIINSDDVSIQSYTAEFGDKNVGQDKSVTLTYTLTGNDAGNYHINPLTSPTANITAKELTITGASVTTKIYDASTDAEITGGSLVGVLNNEVALVSGTGTFNTKNVSTDKAVTANYSLNGTSEAIANYSLTQPTGLAGTVTAKELTILSAAVTLKTYDANTNATITGTLSGLVNSETVTFNETGTFNDANIGTEKAVTSACSLNGVDAGNYSLTQPTSLTGTITAKELTISSAAVSSKTYDANTDATITGTLMGIVNSETVTYNGTGTFNDVNVDAGKPVTSTCSLTGVAAGNYSLTHPINLTGTITAKAIIITTDPISKIYGEADPVFTYTASPAIESGDSFTGVLSRVAGEDVGTFEIQQGTLALSSNYTLSFISDNLTINTRPIEITADNKSKAEGTDDPSLSYTITQGSLAFLDAISGSLARAAGETINTYAINQGSLSAGSNYNLTFIAGTFTITDLLIQEITFNSLDNVTYGGANITLSATGGDSGNPVTFTSSNETIVSISGNTATIVNAGSANITASQLGNANYADADDVIRLLVVDKAVLEVTANNKSKTYGEANPELTFNYSGFVNSETELVLTTAPTATSIADETSDVDTYDITVSGGVADNYSFSYTNGTLTINKADQTISIENISDKDVSDAAFDVVANTTSELELTYAISSGPATISDKTLTLNGNTGTVVIEVSQDGNANYNAATTQSVSFNVSDASLQDQTITFTTISDKLYSDVFDLNATASSGLDVAYTIISGTATVSGSSVTVTGLGEVVIEAKQSGNTEYNPATSVQQTFTVNKAELNVTADNKSKTYGDANPEFTFSYTGFVNSEDATALTTAPTANSTANETTDAGTANITVAGGVAHNYTFSYTEATLTINKAMLTAIAQDTTRKEGEVNPAFEITYSGFVNSDDVSTISELPVASCNADIDSPQGEYDIILTGGSDNNYDFTLVNGTLTITKGVGISNPNLVQLKIYPNPVQSNLHISNIGIENTKIRIFNSSGNLIDVVNAIESTKIDVSQYSQGMYIIKVENSAFRFVKE